MATKRSAPSSGFLSALAETEVSAVMHAGLFTCSADTPLSSVAQIMSEERIHAVVVSGIPIDPAGDDRAWGIVSDLDLLRAAGRIRRPDRGAGRRDGVLDGGRGRVAGAGCPADG